MNTPLNQAIKEIVEKYIENTISDEELKTLEDWVKNADNGERFKIWVKNYFREHKFGSKLDFEKMNLELQKRGLGGSKNKILRIPKFYKYAAVIAFALLSAFQGYRMYTVEKVPALISTTEVILQMEDGSSHVLKASGVVDIAKNKGAIEIQQNKNRISYRAEKTNEKNLGYNVLTVPYGKKFEVELSDRTLVYINAGSSLKYPVQFTEGDPREVFLDGEGYFKVAKDEKHPFIVRTKNMATQVLGTEFNMSSYKDDKSTSVVLVEGSVGLFEGEVYSESNSIKLRPNEMAIREGDRQINVTTVDVEGYISWIEGALFFKNEDFISITKKLERHYNVSFNNNFKQLDAKRFTGTFNTETIEQVLNTFKKTNEFSYSINNGSITINP